jgi:hypothetical protein
VAVVRGSGTTETRRSSRRRAGCEPLYRQERAAHVAANAPPEAGPATRQEFARPPARYVGAHACVAGAAVPWQRRAAPRRRALQRCGSAARAAVRGSGCAGWPRLPAARVRRCSLLAAARDAPGGAGGAGVG